MGDNDNDKDFYFRTTNILQDFLFTSIKEIRESKKSKTCRSAFPITT